MAKARAQFSRFNQPRPCRVCGKGTTWSEANGHGGLDLCRACFEAASVENEHFDGYHDEKPNAHCPRCAAKTIAPEALAGAAGGEDLDEDRWERERKQRLWEQAQPQEQEIPGGDEEFLF